MYLSVGGTASDLWIKGTGLVGSDRNFIVQILEVIHIKSGGKYLCLDCGEVYYSSCLNINELFDNIWCPKVDCDGILVEVDDLLIPTIRILNDKGYATKYCCSGHYTRPYSRAYIVFQEWVEIPFLPNGFKKEDCNGCLCIESVTENKEQTVQTFDKICDDAKILLKWADKLPHLEISE